MENKKKKDDENLFWFIGGGLFAAVLIVVDIWYSSYALLVKEEKLLLGLIVFAHLLIIGLWIGVLIKFEDPNYDYLRKWCVYLTGATIITVCLHHSLNNENRQVLIDAENNRIRDSIEQVQKDSAIQSKLHKK
jgi:hypothetical protein